MTIRVDDWESRARQLADTLVSQGDLRDPAWYAAVKSVARHVLVPVAYEQDNLGAWHEIDVTSPVGLDLVYSPVTLVTALADSGAYQTAVSSSTKPDLVVRMLEILSVDDGSRVLDIGTGSGYQTALLTHRLGEDRVFSVDVDPDLVYAAQNRLAAIGLHPTVLTVDGAVGLPDHAPYDRIIVTCSVSTVPWAWAQQLTTGGMVLVDMKVGVGAGNLVLLTRYPDRLEGRFTSRFGSFMSMRNTVGRHIPETRERRAPETGRQTTGRSPTPWSDHRVVWFLACLNELPVGVHYGMELDPDTRKPTASLLTAPDGSWATVSLTPDNAGRHTVREGGPTLLWGRVEDAYQAWRSFGEPEWPRLGLTVTPEGQQEIWIEDVSGHRSRASVL